MDDVYTRISDLNSAERIFGADIYYHNFCYNQYIRKYNMTKKTPDESSSRQYLSKRRFFDKYVDFIRTVIEQGKGISLSEIRDIINREENVELYNNKIKTFMQDTFGEDIQFCSSERKKSIIVCIFIKN